jgi:hypothetical protein
VHHKKVYAGDWAELHSFLTAELDCGKWSALRSNRVLASLEYETELSLSLTGIERKLLGCPRGTVFNILAEPSWLHMLLNHEFISTFFV